MFAHLSVPLLSSTPYDSGQGEGKVNTYNEPGSSRLSSYRHRICLSILLRIWWDFRNAITFLDCSLPFHPGGKKNSMGF